MVAEEIKFTRHCAGKKKGEEKEEMEEMSTREQNENEEWDERRNFVLV